LTGSVVESATLRQTSIDQETVALRSGKQGKISEAQCSTEVAQQFLLEEPGRLKARDHKGLDSIERPGKHPAVL
jgi:hypothetical protein